MLNLEHFASGSSRTRRRGLNAGVALVVMVVVACSESGVPTGPPEAGAILVTTETTGFLKGASYGLLVEGVSEGTIDANGEMTISGLDPASYSVSLADVPDNCMVESINVSVISGETTEASLSVDCSYADLEDHTLQFGRERLDLDDGTLTVCPFSICSTQEAWDFYVYNGSQTPQPVIRQNQTTGVEIAHLPGVVLDDLAEAHLLEATFTTEIVSDVFDSERVILIRTDVGNVFVLGNPVLDSAAGSLTFEAALIAVP